MVAVTRQGKVYRVLVLSVSNLICIFNRCVVIVLVSCASFVLIEARCAIVLLIFFFFFPVVDIKATFTCTLNGEKKKKLRTTTNLIL